jgi:hypothetical protein
MVATRIGIENGWFEALVKDGKPKTAEELAKATGAELLLIGERVDFRGSYITDWWSLHSSTDEGLDLEWHRRRGRSEHICPDCSMRGSDRTKDIPQCLSLVRCYHLAPWITAELCPTVSTRTGLALSSSPAG